MREEVIRASAPLTLAGAYRKRDRALSRIAAAKESGANDAVEQLIDRYLRSPAARLTAAARVLKAESLNASVHALADNLDPWAVSPEHIEQRPILKADGSVRNIYRFGPQSRALQTMVLDVLRAACPLPAYLHGFSKGYGVREPKGVQHVVEQIANCLDTAASQPAPEYSHFVVADIQDCFGSVNADALIEALPLPADVTRNILLLCEGQRIAKRPTTRARRTRLGGRRSIGVPLHRPSGVPQGSIASGRAIATLFVDLEASLPAWVPVFMFVDDICMLATSAAEAEQVAQTLERYFGTHPAGPYALKHLSVGEVANGFDFLGYEFSTREGEPFVDIAWSSRARLLDWATLELELQFKALRHEPSGEFQQMLRRKLSGYSAYSSVDQYADLLLRDIHAAYDNAVNADVDGSDEFDGLSSLRNGLSMLKHIRNVEEPVADNRSYWDAAR